MQKIDARRHSSPSLFSPSQQLNRQRGVTFPPQILSRPLTSPPPLIPSPARDPEKSRHPSKDLAKAPIQKDNEKARLFSTDRNKQQSARDQGPRDADKGRATSSQEQVSKDSEKNRSPREISQKDSDKNDMSGREPEKRSFHKDSDAKETERGRPPSRDPVRETEKRREINRESEKGRQTSRDSGSRDTNRTKSSSRDASNKDFDKARSLSKDTGQRDSEKHRRYSQETDKASGQGKDRVSRRESDKSGRPPSRDSINRSTDRNKDFGSGKDRNSGAQLKQAADDNRNVRLVPAGSGMSSPLVGTAVLTGQQRSGSVKPIDKHGKEQEVTGNLLPRHRPAPNAHGTQAPASLNKDSAFGKNTSSQPSFQKSSTRKSNEHPSGTATGAAMKPLWPSWTPAEDHVVKQGAVHLASPAAALVAKDKHSKVKTAGSREVSKDREREKQPKVVQNSSNKIPLLNNNNNNTKASSSANTHAANTSFHNNSKASVVGNNTKAHVKVQGEKPENQAVQDRLKNRENYSCAERKNSSSHDGLKQSGVAIEKDARSSAEPFTKQTANQVLVSTREKKRPVKPIGETPVKIDSKTDPNGTSSVGGESSSCPTTTTSTVSPAGQETRCSARPIRFSPSVSSSSSDGSESDSQNQLDEDELRKKHSRMELQDHSDLLSQGTEDEGDGPYDDQDRAMDDKHHEDDSDGSGSAKRRYPRRSARARSNMFFGLTPFYGVRSYGEEDLPFYGGADGAGAVVKRRSGFRKKSAEGQVDGADDMSTTSSSGDSDEDEDGEIKPRGKDSYYYNFTRTIINPSDGLPSIEGLDQCLGKGSQLQRFLKDEAQQQQRAQGKADEDMLSSLYVNKKKYGCLSLNIFNRDQSH